MTAITETQTASQSIAQSIEQRRVTWANLVANYERAHTAMNSHWPGRYDDAETALATHECGSPEYAEALRIMDEAQAVYDILVVENGDALNALMTAEAPDMAALAFKLAIHRDEQLWDGWCQGAKIAVALAADAKRLSTAEA